MHLMCTYDAEGKRIYTLKKVVDGKITKSAHPARFSPDDKYSRERYLLKKRHGLLPMQLEQAAAKESEKATKTKPPTSKLAHK